MKFTIPTQKARPVESNKCHGCGMPTSSLREYHPFAACALFEQTHNSNRVLTNLRAVLEYGMMAQRLGLTASEAMEDLTKVRGDNSVGAGVSSTASGASSENLPASSDTAEKRWTEIATTASDEISKLLPSPFTPLGHVATFQIILAAIRKANATLSETEQQLGDAYGRGVTAGKLEALQYTPEEQERYGKWVAQGSLS